MRRISAILILLALTTGIAAAFGQAPTRGAKSESIVHIDGTNYYIHNVSQGETLYSLSKLYDVGEDDIKRDNPFAREGLRIGQVLKIPVKEEQVSPRRQSKLFEEHLVRAGETAYSIARNYGISVPALVEDNPGVDPTQLPIGQVLHIRKKGMGETKPWEVTQQWEDYRDAANKVSDDYVYHIVKPGETVYSLSRMFNVSQQTLRELNQLDEGLKANSIIRIPAHTSATSGDSGSTTETTQTDQYEPPRLSELDFGGESIIPRQYRQNRIPNIALMLPLDGSAATNTDFADFYRGALLALEDLKSEGRSMNLTLYNSGRSAGKVGNIVSMPSFSNTDLIIGPVYESEMVPALQYANAYGIPIISPLATVRNLDSEMLYQMAPDPRGKYDKLQGMLGSGKNIILVSSGADNDREFESEVVNLLGNEAYGRFTLDGKGDVTSLLDWNRENIFIVLAGSEMGVDKALASISSAYNNASARTSRRADINVIGSSKWAQYNSILDKTLFFKLNVCFVTSYYVDRSNVVVADFESRFLENYGGFPSRSAYRGYDAVKLFGEALFQPGLSFDESLSMTEMTPLQMPYRFVYSDGTQRRVNDQWALVCFRNDFNIDVK